MRHIWRVVTLVPENRAKIGIVVIASAFLGLAGTAVPYLVREFVNIIANLYSHRITQEQANSAVLILGVVFFLMRFCIAVAGHCLEKFGSLLWLNTVETLRQRVFDKIISLSIKYFEATPTGDIMERYTSIPAITLWLFQFSGNLVGSGVLILSGVVVLMIHSPVPGTVMLVTIGLNLAISLAEIVRSAPLRLRVNSLVGELSGLANQTISQIATVRSLAGEGTVLKYYEDAQRRWREQQDAEKAIHRRANSLLGFLNMFAVTGCVALVMMAALDGRSTLGDIVLVLALANSLGAMIGPISQSLYSTSEIESLAQRLCAVLDESPTDRDPVGAIEVGAIESLEFENVSFTYPGKDVPSLRNVSFVVHRGELLALVGPSGSGKSTVAKLLLGLYQPSAGRILVNGRDVNSFKQASLRAQMGVVPQDVALFNDSIENNIRFSRPDATQDEIIKACSDAAASPFIEMLPHGYRTLVGERGVKLSGGEKQRVAIARAMLRLPSVVILDEATSALDPEAERLVQIGLDRLAHGRVSLVIAHRFSTITNANKILFLQDGRVQESGDHASLVQRPHGLYANYAAMQMRL